jgi:hypothetical protein
MKSLLRFALPQLVLVSLSLAQPRDPVVFLFAGDVTLDRPIERVAEEDPKFLSREWNARPYDLFMVNLEHPITTSRFKVPKESN